MKSRGIPPYTMLCNHHFRFYYSNPNRTEFRNHVERKQFLATEKVLKDISSTEYETIKQVITPPKTGRANRDNNYIGLNVKRLCSRTQLDQGAVYDLLRKVTRALALELEYIGEIGGVGL